VLEGTLAELQQSTGCETLVEMFMKLVGDTSDTPTEIPAA
jgi:hypothetical protein